MGFSLLVNPAFAAVPSASVLSVSPYDCGDGKYQVNLKVNFPDWSQLIKIWIDGSLVYNATSGATTGVVLGDNEVKIVKNLTAGTHLLKSLASGEESEQAFNVSDCNAGGGGLAPCQIEKTCPFYGETIFDTEKRMMKDPEYAIKKQLVSLLAQLVELYRQLLRK